MIATNKYVPGTFDPAKLAQILCPNLRTLTNEGLLTPDKDGWVEIKQLTQALEYVGVAGLPKKVLAGGAEKATATLLAEQFGANAKGKFNVYRLAGTNLDHVGDTRILRNGFDQGRLDWLLSFANAEGRLGIRELAGAQEETRKDEQADFRASALGVAELTALCLVYGINGSLSAESVTSLYRDARFPAEWLAAFKAKGSAPNHVALGQLFGGVTEMAARQTFGHTGTSHLGVANATSGDKPASRCPFHWIFRRD